MYWVNGINRLNTWLQRGRRRISIRWNQSRLLGSDYRWKNPKIPKKIVFPKLNKKISNNSWVKEKSQEKVENISKWIVKNIRISDQIRSDQSLSRVWLFATPWIAACQASLSITNSRGSLRLMSIESVMPSSHLILCRPLLLLPPIPPSIRVFSNESTLHMRWPKYWTFSFSIIPSYGHIIKSQKQKEEWTFERKPGECGQKSVFGAKQETSWDAGEGGLKEKVSTNRDSFYLLTSRFAWWNEIEDGKMRRHRRWPSCC